MLPAFRYPWGALARRAAWLHKTGLWSGPSYSWPAKLEAPSLFAEEKPVLLTTQAEQRWSRSEAIKRGQGRLVCTDNAVGIFGYRSCYYLPYPWWKRRRNALAFWLDMHRGAFVPHKLIEKIVAKWYARRILKRLARLQKERRKQKPTNSHFLKDRKETQ